jgi:hypothetical protein
MMAPIHDGTQATRHNSQTRDDGSLPLKGYLANSATEFWYTPMQHDADIALFHS